MKSNVTSQQIEAQQAWVETAHKNRLARRDDPSLTGVKFKCDLSTLKGCSGAFDEINIQDIQAQDEV